MRYRYFGCSTGDTGEYGVGDIVRGVSYTKDGDGNYLLDDEPVFHVWTIEDNDCVYVG